MAQVRMVLLGKTGEGKSKTGNTILGHNAFESRISASSVTKTCQVASAYRFGKTVTVIDTPGYCDTEMSEQQIKAEVTKSVHLSAPGPHVFILVVRPERFTLEEQRAIRLTKEYFGSGIFNRMIVLFAKRDHLDHEGISLKQFLSTAPPDLQQVIRDAGNRYITFNNRAGQPELDSQAQELMTVVNGLLNKCGNTHYTPKLLDDAVKEKHRQDEIRKTQEEEKRRLEREKVIEEEKRKTREEARRKQEENERRIRELEAENVRIAEEEKREKEAPRKQQENENPIKQLEASVVQIGQSLRVDRVVNDVVKQLKRPFRF